MVPRRVIVRVEKPRYGVFGGLWGALVAVAWPKRVFGTVV